MPFLPKLLLKIAEGAGRLRWRLESLPLGYDLLRAYRLAYWRAKLARLDEGSYIYPDVVIHSPEKVRIGAHVNIAEFVHIWGAGDVEIGDNTIIAAHAIITSQTHDKSAPIFRDSNRMASVFIGANCWIGAGAIVLPGIRIGEGSIVGAQAVVTKDVPPHSMVVGIPARMVGVLGPKQVPDGVEDGK